MGSQKTSIEERVETDYKGITYRGTTVIEGTRKLFQTVYYGANSKFDGRSYTPEKRTLMREIAKTILREMVEEELGSQKPAAR